MVRLFFAGAIALGSAGMAALAVPASADPICVSAATSGAVGDHTVGPRCIGYPDATECNTTNTGLGTLVNVTETTCVPAP